jgi:hypothetical protein
MVKRSQDLLKAVAMVFYDADDASEGGGFAGVEIGEQSVR